MDQILYLNPHEKLKLVDKIIHCKDYNPIKLKQKLSLLSNTQGVSTLNTQLINSTIKRKKQSFMRCELHNQHQKFVDVKEKRLLCCSSLTELKESLSIKHIQKSDELSLEFLNSWESLIINTKTLVEEYLLRAKLHGQIWSLAFDKCLQKILKGCYSPNKPIISQFEERVMELYKLIEAYYKKCRADKILQVQDQYNLYKEEYEHITQFLIHTSISKEEKLAELIKEKVLEEYWYNEKQIQKDKLKVSYINSFLKDQGLNNISKQIKNTNEKVDRMMTLYKLNKDEKSEQMLKDCSSHVSIFDQVAVASQQLNPEEKRTIVQLENKDILNQVNELQKEIVEKELLAKSYKEEALNEEILGQNYDAFEDYEKACLFEQTKKLLQVKKNYMLKVLDDRRRSYQKQAKKKIPSTARPYSNISQIL